MSQYVRDGLHAKLVSDTSNGSVYDLVGGRIYEGRAPQAAELPLLVYRLSADPLEHFFGGAVTQDSVVDIEVFGPLDDQDVSDGSDAAQDVGTIERKVYDLLNGATLTVTDHDRGKMFCISRNVPEVLDDSHVARAQYRVMSTNF